MNTCKPFFGKRSFWKTFSVEMIECPIDNRVFVSIHKLGDKGKQTQTFTFTGKEWEEFHGMINAFERDQRCKELLKEPVVDPFDPSPFWVEEPSNPTSESGGGQ